MLLRMLWVVPAAIIGIGLFWLLPLKLLWRLIDLIGLSTPCPDTLAALVDNPVRRRYMGRVLDRVGIRPGDCVLELGPGPGTFTVEAARRAGPEGRPIAVDIQPEMIARVEQRVQHLGVENIETHIASAFHLPLDDGSVDRAFLVTVLPEIPDHTRALRELRRVLRPRGLLSVTEEFPDPDYRFACETIRSVEAAGYRVEERFGNFWVYTVNFRKDDRARESCPRPAQGSRPASRPAPGWPRRSRG
jgi:SAM-dependent methyltransferase